MNPREYAKALVGAVIAGASFAIPVVDDGVTASEGLGILVAALAALAAVWAVPNSTPATIPHSPPTDGNRP